MVSGRELIQQCTQRVPNLCALFDRRGRLTLFKTCATGLIYFLVHVNRINGTVAKVNTDMQEPTIDPGRGGDTVQITERRADHGEQPLLPLAMDTLTRS